MSTALDLAPTSGKTDEGDDLDHYYCCDINLSMCGLDITDADDRGDDEPTGLICVVCDDLEGAGCANPKCPDRDTG